MEENKKARNLSVLSFTVILYVIGGAKFQESGSLLGGSVNFSKPWVLEYAGIVLLCFYLYRFLLVTRLFKNIGEKTDWYLTQSPGFTSYVQQVLSKTFQERIAAGEFSSGSKANWRTHPQPNPIVNRKLLERSVNADVVLNGVYVTTFKLKLSCWRTYYFESFAGLKAVFLTEFFWDDVFPILLCAAAFVLAALRKLGYV